ncbi:hypothetical protein HAX54_040256, partial [Datura stramonium]|nr:hypothetical protein [Datura stramonium]
HLLACGSAGSTNDVRRWFRGGWQSAATVRGKKKEGGNVWQLFWLVRWPKTKRSRRREREKCFFGGLVHRSSDAAGSDGEKKKNGEEEWRGRWHGGRLSEKKMKGRGEGGGVGGCSPALAERRRRDEEED